MVDRELKTNMVHFRATDRELNFYRSKAQQLNMSLSLIIRMALIEYLKDK